MHHIYHTEGIILSSRNFGEAGKYYHILTKDLGLILTSAQGVRKMESKLRYVLQDGSYVNIDLVKTKDFWRITTASKKNELDEIPKDKEKFSKFIQISKLLKRLLPGEGINQDFFSDFIKGLKLLEKSKSEETNSIEIMIVLRILYHLGYVGGEEIFAGLTQSPLEEKLILEIAKQKTKVISHINKALKESQL